MAEKPTDLPEWATTGGTTLEPSAGEKAAGWTASTRPPARWMNWLLNLIYKWVQYLNAPVGTGAGAGMAATGGSTSGPGFQGTGGAPNGAGQVGQGTGTGAGGSFVGGASSGTGCSGTGGGPNGHGQVGQGTGTGSGGAFTGGANGPGVQATAGGGNNDGVRGVGSGTGAGGNFSGGATGRGLVVNAGGGNCNGVESLGAGTAAGGYFQGGATDGTGLSAVGGGTAGKGLYGSGKGSSPGVRGESETGDAVSGVGGGTGSGGSFTGGANGKGLTAAAGGGNNSGIEGTGAGTGAGLLGTAGAATGPGVSAAPYNQTTGTRAALHLGMQLPIGNMAPGDVAAEVASLTSAAPKIVMAVDASNKERYVPQCIALFNESGISADVRILKTITANTLTAGSVIEVDLVVAIAGHLSDSYEPIVNLVDDDAVTVAFVSAVAATGNGTAHLHGILVVGATPGSAVPVSGGGTGTRDASSLATGVSGTIKTTAACKVQFLLSGTDTDGSYAFLGGHIRVT